MKKKHHLFWIGLSATTLAAGLAGLAIYEHYLPRARQSRCVVEKYPFGLLLGCACRKDGSYSNEQRLRAQLAVELYQENAYQTLIISGGSVRNDHNEAEAIATLVQEMDPSIPIILEKHARNTWENFQNVKDMTGDVPMLVITGALHARRAGAIAHSFYSCYQVASIPDFTWKKAAREAVSRMKYIRIEMGKDLDKDLKKAD